MGAVVLGALIGERTPSLTSIALGISFAGIAAMIARRSSFRLAEVPMYTVAAGVAFAPANGVRVGDIPVGDLLLLAAIPLIMAASLASPRDSVSGALPGLLAGGALILIAAFATELFPPPELNSQLVRARNLGTGQIDDAGSLELATRFVIALVAVPVIIASVVRMPRAARLITSAWIGGTVASALVAVLAGFTPLDLQASLTGREFSFDAYRGLAPRETGLAVHPTLLGVSAALVMPVVLVRMARTDPWRYGGCAVVLALAILVSGSRIAVIATLLAGVLILSALSTGRARLVGVVAVGGVGLVLSGVGPATLSSVQRLGGTTSSHASDQERTEALAEGWQVFLDRPISGVGFEAIRGAHNAVLEVLSSGGLIAFLGYLFGLAIVTNAGRHVRAHAPPGPVRDELTGLLAAVGVLAFVGLTTNATLDRFLYLAVGVLLGYSRLVSAPSRPNQAPARLSSSIHGSS